MKLLLKHCGILAWEQGAFRYLRDGYLGIDGDTINYVGEARPQGGYDREKDMSRKLLLPGLINCHGHTPMTLLRGIGSDLPLQEWLYLDIR